MSKIIRLILLTAFVGGVITAASHFHSDSDSGGAAQAAVQPTAATTRPPAPGPSQVDRSTDSSGTLVSFALIPGDALVIRLSENEMTSCTFKIHTGPLEGSEHAAAEVAVDYQVVAVASWRSTVELMGQACDQYWQIID